MRLLYVVTEDWYFLSHRLPTAIAARDAGYEVHVATRVSNGGQAIEALGFGLHPVPFARGRLKPRDFLGTVRALRKIQRDLKPAITHHVALQALVLGSLAATGLPGAHVNALTGLGYLFMSPSPDARAARALMAPLLRVLTNHRKTAVLVQNPDDHQTLSKLGVKQQHLYLIPGSGIDVEQYRELPEPEGRATVAFVGRLLEDKGIRTVIAAHRIMRERGRDIELIIAGMPDPANPTSIPLQEAATWNRLPGVCWLGHVHDIASVWARAHIAVLPSRREGLPKSLLEAAACGRAMVAADVPGCREVVRHEQTGLLVPVDDPSELASAIERLAAEPGLRRRFGHTARGLAADRFSSAEIGRQTVELYRNLLDGGARPQPA